jgi:hypothetical protein
MSVCGVSVVLMKGQPTAQIVLSIHVVSDFKDTFVVLSFHNQYLWMLTKRLIPSPAQNQSAEVNVRPNVESLLTLEQETISECIHITSKYFDKISKLLAASRCYNSKFVHASDDQLAFSWFCFCPK